MSDMKKIKEELPKKEKFYSYLTGKKNCGKEYGLFLKVWKRFDMKMIKYYHDFLSPHHRNSMLFLEIFVIPLKWYFPHIFSLRLLETHVTVSYFLLICQFCYYILIDFPV